MKLEPCIKIADGRCETPENTVRRLEAVIGSLYDYRMIEEQVADSLHWSALFIDELGFRSMGKGISQVLSRAGALAEGAEWLTMRELGTLPGYRRAHQDVLENPLTIESLLGHVASVTPEVLERVKRTDCALHWVDGESLLDGRALQVPMEYVRRIAGPSGLAAGNRIEEAIVHAVNEVFERRAHITVLRQRMVMPTIDPDSVAHPVIRDHLAFVRGKGIEVTLKDLSFGGVLPCVGAYFCDPNIPDTFQFHHFFKVGASFNREEALIRCFTEYVQGRRLDEFIDGSRAAQDRVLGHDFRSLKCIDSDGDNFLSAFLFGFVPCRDADFLREGDRVAFDRGECFDDCLDDIGAAGDICRTLGKDFVVVDFTDPKIGFPVAQVIVPGYSDVLPYHPASSDVLWRGWTREDVLCSYTAGVPAGPEEVA